MSLVHAGTASQPFYSTLKLPHLSLHFNKIPR
jgi:hypothetical protein